MMRGRSTIWIAVWVLLTVATAAEAQDTTHITYISAEAVYINAGKLAGLAAGDTLGVTRGAARVGRVVITNIASHSSACAALDGEVKVGDIIEMPTSLRATPIDATHDATVSPWTGRRTNPRTNVRGFVSLENRWQRDLTGSGPSWYQPGMNARVTVTGIAGRNISFRFRHRSLVYLRSGSLNSPLDRTEWVHRLSEVALLFGSPDSPMEVGIGRVVSPQIRGIGYIDGAYFSVAVARRYRVGAAFGTVPSPSRSSVRLDHQQVGAFITQELGSYGGSRLHSTLAVSAAYAEHLVDREFVYLQNQYTYTNRLSIYQSVEVDINRQWRRIATGERISFSNLYLTTNYNPASWLSLDGSFDARKNIWSYQTMETPDSLFNRGLSRGTDAGVSLRLPGGISLRGRTGIRFGDELSDEIRFSSLFINVHNVPLRGHHLTARISRSETPFTIGHLPAMTYRFPFIAHLRANVGFGAYLYDTNGLENNSYYAEAGTSRTFSRRYFFSADLRQYVGGALESSHLSVETGITF